jgi:outer membrane immunogenic protein
MRLMNAALLATIGIATLGANPHAQADGVPQYSAPVTLTPSNWTGPYAGIHLGGTWGSTGAFDLNGYNVPPGGAAAAQSGPPLPPGDRWHSDTSGFVAGGQLGYNWQIGALLLGVEGDVGDLGLTGNAPTHAPLAAQDTSSRTEADFYLTARGRMGFVADNWLFYATGGYFGAQTRVSILDTCFVAPPCGRSTMNASDQSFRSGWTAGGGIEWDFSGPWSAKAEYLYYDLGSTTASGLAGGVGPVFSWDVDTHGNIVRAAINYRFTGFGY